jgi:hypothetical protein
MRIFLLQLLCWIVTATPLLAADPVWQSRPAVEGGQTKKDGQIQIEAHTGRIALFQNFELGQMEFMGQLEL